MKTSTNHHGIREHAYAIPDSGDWRYASVGDMRPRPHAHTSSGMGRHAYTLVSNDACEHAHSVASNGQDER